MRFFRYFMTSLVLFLFCVLVSFASAEDKRYDVPIGDSPRMGPDGAPVTIIEFLDFQ